MTAQKLRPMSNVCMYTCDLICTSTLQCDRLAGGLQKLAEASEQLAELNEKLAIQKVAVTEKTDACEKLLAEISSGTTIAEEKKTLAIAKGKEIEEQSKVIAVEKVCSIPANCVFLNLCLDGQGPQSCIVA